MWVEVGGDRSFLAQEIYVAARDLQRQPAVIVQHAEQGLVGANRLGWRDLEFVGDVPNNIRRGQSLQVRLSLSDETQAVLVAKGGFYQQTGGNWIYKLNKDGSKAYKAEIQLGRQNPDYYEVLSGLKPGDKVVSSSYENYGDNQELRLK